MYNCHCKIHLKIQKNSDWYIQHGKISGGTDESGFRFEDWTIERSKMVFQENAMILSDYHSGCIEWKRYPKYFPTRRSIQHRASTWLHISYFYKFVVTKLLFPWSKILLSLVQFTCTRNILNWRTLSQRTFHVTHVACFRSMFTLNGFI